MSRFIDFIDHGGGWFFILMLMLPCAAIKQYNKHYREECEKAKARKQFEMRVNPAPNVSWDFATGEFKMGDLW